MRALLFTTLTLVAVSLGGITVVLAGRSFQDRFTVDHTYYTMSVYQDNAEFMYDKYWVNMSESQVHRFLSNHSQAAEKIEPGFIFPFYGHLVHDFYVTTHGFLSFAPHLHNLMYKTQYVAPLRVKLDPSRFDHSTVNYRVHGLGGEAFTVQWTNVTVAEPFEHPMGGTFTFQVTLHANGNIVFVYVYVPDLLTTDALYDSEPVAGLSDAFLIGDSELHVYHTLNVDNTDIRTGTVVVFHTKPTCIRQTNCDDCATLRESSEFKCAWCPGVHRCSDGADRLREHWDQNGCGIQNATSGNTCSNGDDHHTEWRNSMADGFEDGLEPLTEAEPSSSVMNAVSAVVSTGLVILLLAVVAAFVYLYGRRNPGGIAERVAMRLEASYKRFGAFEGDQDEDRVELESRQHHQEKPSSSDNNNSITVSF